MKMVFIQTRVIGVQITEIPTVNLTTSHILSAMELKETAFAPSILE